MHFVLTALMKQKLIKRSDAGEKPVQLSLLRLRLRWPKIILSAIATHDRLNREIVKVLW
jgi:hypothetical protein